MNLKIAYNFIKSSYAKLMVFIYIFLLLTGLLLFCIYIIIPAFDATYCIMINGTDVCSVLGLYITVLSSIPGYLIVGFLLNSFFFILPVWLTYFLVVAVNIGVYFMIGKYADSLVRSKNNPQIFTYNLTIGLAIILGVSFLFMKYILATSGN